MERVQGGYLHRRTERVTALVQPRRVRLPRPAGHQVQEPGPDPHGPVPAGAPGQVDHPGQLLRAAPALFGRLGADVVPHVLVHPEGVHTGEPGLVVGRGLKDRFDRVPHGAPTRPELAADPVAPLVGTEADLLGSCDGDEEHHRRTWRPLVGTGNRSRKGRDWVSLAVSENNLRGAKGHDLGEGEDTSKEVLVRLHFQDQVPVRQSSESLCDYEAWRSVSYRNTGHAPASGYALDSPEQGSIYEWIIRILDDHRSYHLPIPEGDQNGWPSRFQCQPEAAPRRLLHNENCEHDQGYKDGDPEDQCSGHPLSSHNHPVRALRTSQKCCHKLDLGPWQNSFLPR